ncbi:MAG TPA: PQQ-dependent dehydrogenase, methanol/ethanol family [Longimicrobiales bacterium]|nr:PQQ-dependent dehydrogenase, methanol/ethanol family [Longimicrobiales bacterium]
MPPSTSLPRRGGAPLPGLLGLLTLAAASCDTGSGASPSLDAAAVTDEVLEGAAGYTGQWLTHGGTYAEQRFSPLAQIDTDNVGQLGLAWSFDTGLERGHEATPLVVGRTLYTTGSWSVVFALDAASGELLWRWDPEVDRAWAPRACCDVVNRGVAVYEGKVFVGVLDGRLAALNAATGELLWETVTVDQSLPYTITGAPRVVAGRVIIGNGGAEYGVRGYVSAYDPDTGELLWRTYTVPGNPADGFESGALERAAETWSGEWWRYGAGGTVWDGMAYDPELDLLYVGTGNGTPWNQQIRSPDGGDNLYLSSILAVRPATGEIVWHYQTTPGETWDYTATQPIVLADLEIDGRVRRVLMQAPKNGFFYVLDRTNGELISAEPYVPMNWATRVDLESGRPVEIPEARFREGPWMVTPGPLGGHNWHPMSFNPITGLVYVPAQVNSYAYGHARAFQYREGVWNTGIGDTEGAGGEALPTSGYLLAWDPVAGEERWRVEYPDMWNGGTLTTAGNLVFQGTSDWRFVAYAADTGERLWETEVPAGVIAGPITYEVEGTQYVAVMAGWGGAYGLRVPGPASTGELLVFALGGTAPLARPVLTTDREAPAPIPFDAPAAAIAGGASLYRVWCAACHGPEGVGGGVVPDLRYAEPGVYDSFDDIVLGGARLERGMPSFAEWLDPASTAMIRAYLLSLRAGLTAN